MAQSRLPKQEAPSDPYLESNFRKVAESPAYIARSAHTDGHIIVTADYTGAIKVYCQDCVYHKRLWLTDIDTVSLLSCRKGFMRLGRASSVIASRTGRTRRDSTFTSRRTNASCHGGRILRTAASSSLAKSRTSMDSSRPLDSSALGPVPSQTSTLSGPSGTPKTSLSIDRSSTHRSNGASEASTPSKTGRNRKSKLHHSRDS